VSGSDLAHLHDSHDEHDHEQHGRDVEGRRADIVLRFGVGPGLPKSLRRPPEQVMRLFRRVIPTGVDHGTVTVLLPGMQVEVTTLRTEVGYADGRRPDQVDFVHSIEEDLARRDFTVNAIAFEPRAEALIDPFGGLDDLRSRRLRAVGEAARRFAEDGLRVLRAARFVATLEFELDESTGRLTGRGNQEDFTVPRVSARRRSCRVPCCSRRAGSAG